MVFPCKYREKKQREEKKSLFFWMHAAKSLSSQKISHKDSGNVFLGRLLKDKKP